VSCFFISIVATQFLEKFLTSNLLLERKRNFYGVVEVVEDTTIGKGFRLMNSGDTIHGSESSALDQKGKPIAYYSNSSPVGRILETTFLDRHRKIGVIGLGVGSLSFYARPSDEISFFEINPTVIELAKKWFSFLSNSNTSTNITLGDARIVLSNLSYQDFDILVVDAFSGDSIPTHLITLEAMKLYLSHLKHDGILIYHISNRFLSLAPVLSTEAIELKLKGVEAVSVQSDKNGFILPSQYFVIAKDRNLEQIKLQLKNSSLMIVTEGEKLSSPIAWTDSFSNVMSALK